MRMKRISCMVFICMLAIYVICIPANAAETDHIPLQNTSINVVAPRATESFHITIGARKTLSAQTSFPLAAWETVTIKASYSPYSASVDFGLVDSDGTFYYYNISDGSIDKTIQVDESGDYTLQVRNNSNVEVEVSGFVNY